VKVAERMIEANGVELCTESFGRPTDPAILLIMGIGASMLWWEEGFCRLLAEGGRFVIRYDHRDTGRSVTYEPERPEYTGADLIADAVGVLDAYGIPAAHVVGVSAGGAFAQLLALDYPIASCCSSSSVARDAGRTWAPVGHGAVPAVCGERARSTRLRRASLSAATSSVRTTSRRPRTTAWPRRARCRASRCPRSPSLHW
jgi:pimeloyl-ACP methyl ester carboxylesterase